MNEEPSFDPKCIPTYLDMIYHQNKKIEEMLGVILFKLSEHEDDKLDENINKYLLSYSRDRFI